MTTDRVAMTMTRAASSAAAAEKVNAPPDVTALAETLFRNEERQVHIRTDQHFFWLFLVQWLGGIVLCGLVSPVAWQGTTMSIHEHLVAAVGLGGLIVGFPMALIRLMRGCGLTRHAVAAAQMLFAALLIHLTGGRLETHFHVFGSLAFLAFYRDPRVLITATVVVGLDHWLRSEFWPESVFGVSTGSLGRVLEHVGWVAFENAFLCWSIALSRRGMRAVALRQAKLEEANHRIQEQVLERQRAEERLRESERQFRTAIAKSPIPVMMYDEGGVVRLLSQGWTAYSGYTLEDIPTLGDWTQKAYNGRSDAVRAHIDQLFSLSEPVHEGEWTIRAKNGEPRVWDFHTVPLGKDGSGKRLLVSKGVDVTERKDAERQKNEFLALLAHELRNPLAPICSALHVLGEPAADAATVDQMRQMAERQVGHMARLLDDLLDVARISQGRFELRKEAVELGAALEGAAGSVRPFCEERRHELQVRRPAHPLWVQADRTRLEQVLTNLLNNAAKYTDPGGQIRLSAEAGAAEAVIRVRDTGIGIAPAMLPRIFELFVQGERRLTRSAGGVGIGLSLVKRLVELHGGRVDAFSPGLGQGSEFVVRLPALPGADPGRAMGQALLAGDQPQAAAGPAGWRVLVVDDNVDAAEGFAAALRLHGHEVRVAYDGPSALALADHFQPQAVLLDLGLPGMDGYEVARQLRENPALKRAWLAAVTGWGQPEDRQRSKDRGFACHLVKPVRLALLVQLLAEVQAGASG